MDWAKAVWLIVVVGLMTGGFVARARGGSPPVRRRLSVALWVAALVGLAFTVAASISG